MWQEIKDDSLSFFVPMVGGDDESPSAARVRNFVNQTPQRMGVALGGVLREACGCAPPPVKSAGSDSDNDDYGDDDLDCDEST